MLNNNLSGGTRSITLSESLRGADKVLKVDAGILSDGFYNNSDIRLKDIKKDDINLTLEEMSSSPLISFKYKNIENDNLHIGTTAQYWKEILPEVVGEDPENYLSLNYSELNTAMCISLSREIVKLKNRIVELEKQYNSI